MPKFNVGQTVWYAHYNCESPGDMDVHSGEIFRVYIGVGNDIKYDVGGIVRAESEVFATADEAVQRLRMDVLNITDSWQKGLEDFFVRFHKGNLKFKRGDTVYLSQVDFYRNLAHIIEAKVTGVSYNWVNGSVQYDVEWDDGERSALLNGGDIYATREEAVAAALKDCEKHLKDLKQLIMELKGKSEEEQQNA